MGELTVEIEDGDRGVCVSARGELDLATAERLQRAIIEAEDRAGARPLTIDYSALDFMDSTGLQVLLDADVRALEAGRELVVVPGAGEARRVLELADALERLKVTEVR